MSNETTLDKTAQSDAQHINKFFASMKTLDESYEGKKEEANLKDDRSLIEFQNEFWLKTIATFEDAVSNFEDSANKLEQIGRKEQSNEIGQTLLDYHILAALYKHKINEYWPISDSESRKRTILIALAELEQLHDEILSKLNGTNESISIIDLTNDESDERDTVNASQS